MMPETQPHLSSEDFLCLAEQTYRKGTVAYRDTNIEIGRLLHLYVRRALEEKDAMKSRERKATPIRRAFLISTAAARLGITTNQVHIMIRTAMAVELLSENGDLGYLTFKHVIVLSRMTGRRHGCRTVAPGHRDFPHAAMEEWIIKPACKDARTIFQRAVNEQWDWKRTLQEVNAANPDADAFRGRAKGPRLARRAAQPSDELPADDDRPRIDAPKAIKACSPREAAQLLYEQLLSNDDPKATAHHIASMLGAKQFDYDVRAKRLRHTA